jgi:hypothetical protein
MEVVTLVNRSSKPVKGLWDGKPYILAPNGKVALPVVVAEAIKRQNVVMGTEDPFSGEMECLVGIVEQGDPLTPIEQSRAITRRELAKDELVVPGKAGMYASEARSSALPVGGQVETTFGKS